MQKPMRVVKPAHGSTHTAASALPRILTQVDGAINRSGGSESAAPAVRQQASCAARSPPAQPPAPSARKQSQQSAAAGWRWTAKASSLTGCPPGSENENTLT